MAERPHSPPLGTGGQPVMPGDMAELVRRVSEQPVYVDAVFDAATTATVRHPLRRRYVGGIVIGASVGSASALTVRLPSSLPATVDPATHVLVDAQGVYTGTVRVWVL